MFQADINTVIGDAQFQGFTRVIKQRNDALRKAGANVFFGEPRRRISNVNIPFVTGDVAPAIDSPAIKNFADAYTSDARDKNEVYREKASEGGLLETKSQTKESLRGYYGVSAVFRRLSTTVAQRLDILESLDQCLLKVMKDTVNSEPELRAVGPQFLDPGLCLQPGTDAAGTPNVGLMLSQPTRRCCPIKPGIIVGKGEQILGQLLHRRTAVWGASFELDLYFVCLESKLEVSSPPEF